MEIHTKVEVTGSVTPTMVKRFGDGWPSSAISGAIGFIDDIDDGLAVVVFEEGPGPRVVVPMSTLDIAPIPAPGKGADCITKIYLVDRRHPVLVVGELEDVRQALILSIPDDLCIPIERWAKFQRVEQDGMISLDEVVVNPLHVVSLASDRSL